MSALRYRNTSSQLDPGVFKKIHLLWTVNLTSYCISDNIKLPYKTSAALKSMRYLDVCFRIETKTCNSKKLDSCSLTV